ncbi:rCG62688, isoform CRA_c [Rattus norvegicus]|uniref:RCG62688, isoform CRA_c n=1 Tax=Rattus norvegicus TaxID=10116 RepID=A6J6N3_RAT|nr:rCG62688, isoform CRA_c [Rattus norvegicus]
MRMEMGKWTSRSLLCWWLLSQWLVTTSSGRTVEHSLSRQRPPSLLLIPPVSPYVPILAQAQHAPKAQQ